MNICRVSNKNIDEIWLIDLHGVRYAGILRCRHLQNLAICQLKHLPDSAKSACKGGGGQSPPRAPPLQNALIRPCKIHTKPNADKECKAE